MTRKQACISANGMRPRIYPLLARCVEEGVAYGYRRAHKHTDTPTEHELREAIESAVLAELCEWFTWPDEYERSHGDEGSER